MNLFFDMIVRAFIDRYQYYMIHFRYKNVIQSALFFVYKNETESVLYFAYKNVIPPPPISKI